VFGNIESVLPLGTAVRLKEKKAIYIITGLCPKLSYGSTSDYLAVRYPCGYEGTLDSQYLINSENIEEVVYKGYIDEKYEEMRGKVIEFQKDIIQEHKVAEKPKESILD